MKYWLIFFPLFIFSCSSTLDFHVPTQNFSTPEVVGDTLDIRTQVTYTNSTRFELASLERDNIFSSSATISTEKGTTKDNVLNGNIGIGLKDFMEFTYRSYSDSPDLFGVKFQLVGRDQGEKKEGLKLSLLAGYGNSTTDNDTITATNGSGTTRTYTTKLDVESFEVGGVIGYRVNHWFLPYLAYNFRSSDAKGLLSSAVFTDVNLRNKAKVFSTQLGIQLNSQDSYFLFEGGHNRSEWGGLEPLDDYTLGLALGLVFR
ncbi:MAG: hypothetical protein VXV96_10700 [Bdellovibrionota bacterium]|jgi:hypothetical protein|nr:hypothetical protein [Bdellovibrionota bacterium]